jgi:uncharacterized protein involved in tolerance to divalent cations
MILLHVGSSDDKVLHTIAKQLLKEKFVADVRIDTIHRLTFDKQDNLVEVPLYLLVCKTKALLFTLIIDFLRQQLGEQLPEIYALPIVSMERSQEELLRNRTRSA